MYVFKDDSYEHVQIQHRNIININVYVKIKALFSPKKFYTDKFYTTMSEWRFSREFEVNKQHNLLEYDLEIRMIPCWWFRCC